MATTAPELLAEHNPPAVGLSLATAAVCAAALLIYVSGTFQIAAVFGAKQLVQALLVVPVAAAAAYYLALSPRRAVSPLMAFAFVKLATEIVMRGQVSYMLDSVAAILALTVVACAPAQSFRRGAAFAVGLSGVFAVMALVQLAWFMWDPRLARFGLVMSEEDVLLNTIDHPIALLGFIEYQNNELLGLPVIRMQSFAKEPSLNVVYFMLPGCLALLLRSRTSLLWGGATLTFCILSLSGSVYLACAFTAIWWVLLRFVSVEFVIPYGMVVFLIGFLFIVQYFGLDALLDGIAYLTQYGDVFNKNVSLTDRSAGAVINAGAAFTAPFGSATISNIPGPWLVNSALAAGWLGVLALLLFLRNLGRELGPVYARSTPLDARWFGSLLLIGALGTIIVFNDYQMGNYAGLVVLAFIHRTLQLQNGGAQA